uniref:UDENN domain-containing protein n=1 Tax=Pavo cristatus TaxID=9049 RepID=A0A8C9F529_PAVCR
MLLALPIPSESATAGSGAPRSIAPGPLHVGATMASSISSLLRRSLRRSGRREGRKEGPAADSIPSHVPLGKAGERSSILYSAGQFFFEYLVVVSLKKMSDGRYEPKITYQFPKRENLLKGQKEEEERLLQAIPLFCFPDGNNWEPVTTFPSETFSFVLTNVDGSRKIGYCRRLLPAGRGARLPEVFCIISCLGCFGLFSKILDEVEKRRQISMAVIYPFMQGLRESPFPAPGKRVTIKSFIPESGTEVGSGDSVPSVLLQHGAVCMGVGRAVRTSCPGRQRCCLPWVRAVLRMRMDPPVGDAALQLHQHGALSAKPHLAPFLSTAAPNSLSVSAAVLGLRCFTPLPQGCNPAVQAAARPLHRLS